MSSPKSLIIEPTKPKTEEEVHPATGPLPAAQPAQAETKPAVKA